MKLRTYSSVNDLVITRFNGPRKTRAISEKRQKRVENTRKRDTVLYIFSRRNRRKSPKITRWTNGHVAKTVPIRHNSVSLWKHKIIENHRKSLESHTYRMCHFDRRGEKTQLRPEFSPRTRPMGDFR